MRKRFLVAALTLLSCAPAAAGFRGALYDMTEPTTVPNIFYSAPYVNVAYRGKIYDTDQLMDETNYQQFVVPRGVSKVRLKCGFIWTYQPAPSRVQIVITKNHGFYPGLTPHNQPSLGGGTTDDITIATHVLPVVPGDTFQCAAWQSQLTEDGPPRDIRVSSFSIEIVE